MFNDIISLDLYKFIPIFIAGKDKEDGMEIDVARVLGLVTRSVMDGGHVASLLCPPYSSEYDFAISRRFAPEVCYQFPALIEN